MNLVIKQIKSTTTESAHLTSHFIISELFLGNGLTIGNSLRRMLLLNLKGTALIAIKISNICHEFSSIYGIREDILEILLNLKEITLKTQTNKGIIHYGLLTADGPGIITGNCLSFNSNIKIINPNQYIATLYLSTKITFEVIAMSNKGYRLNYNQNLRYSNFLNIDAIFMPILKVNYKIITKLTILKYKTESLLLELTTNGSIAPYKAFHEASFLLKRLFSSMLLK
uniref:RNA polymerase subunit alpha n=1 Tax=Pteridomonas sp. YPF1301 TaxID=2766739 RepID=A0A7G1MNE1_9STRA|nr:RNA polymerase subunit alpha [Pteridomonas sp. YPF1301]